jgi:hypothetical protein
MSPQRVLQELQWVVGFAAAFMLLHWLTMQAGPLFDIIPGSISLIYLPAFLRVVSIMVAGSSGVVGIGLGVFLMSWAYHDRPLLVSLAETTAACLAIVLAHAALRQAMGVARLPITFWNLIAMTGIYCACNAVTHGIFWGLLEMDFSLAPWQLSLMMVGDLLGVVTMFLISRIVIRRARQLSL